MAVEVIFSPASEREIRKLSRVGQKAVFKAIEVLEASPRPRGVEKIQGHPGFFRLRAGDFRVVYYPITAERVVILVIADRKDAYKGVDELEGKLERAMQDLPKSASL